MTVGLGRGIRRHAAYRQVTFHDALAYPSFPVVNPLLYTEFIAFKCFSPHSVHVNHLPLENVTYFHVPYPAHLTCIRGET